MLSKEKEFLEHILSNLSTGCLRLNPVIFLVFIIALAQTVAAQPLIVPLKANTKIFQPGEQIIIGFNGKREIIVIRQHLKSTHYTEAIRIIPFPSEVAFRLDDISLFSRLRKLTDKKKLSFERVSRQTRKQRKGRRYQFFISDRYLCRPSGIVELKISKLDELAHYIKSSLRDTNKNEKHSLLTESQVSLFKTYLEKNFNYFYFDEIKIRPKTRGIFPVRFSFDTNKLYCPFSLAQFFFRSGDIKVYVIYKEGSIDPHCLSWTDDSGPFSNDSHLSREEVNNIDHELASLFKKGKIKIKLMRFVGQLNSLSSDLFCGGDETS